MLIIDFHTHCFPDSIAEHAIETLRGMADIPNYHDGTLADLDTMERADGSGGYVLLPISTNPAKTAHINSFAASCQDETRHVYAFGSVHPENADYRNQLADAKAMGLHGIKMHPEYQAFHVDDESVFPIYEEIFRQGLPLLLHAGEDIGFRPPWHSQPYKIAKVAERFPEAAVIAAHMGGYNMWRQAAEVLAPLPNVYIDTSFCAAEMSAEDFQEILRIWGSRRILFGTDMPWKPVAVSIAAVRRLDCTEEIGRAHV